MSRSPFFYLERYDFAENKWRIQAPIIYDVTLKKETSADLYPFNGDHKLFELLEEGGCELAGVHSGLPKDSCEEIQKAYKECCDPDYYLPHARWITYADLYIYDMEHQKVRNLDYDPEYDSPDKEFTTNPVRGLLNRVNAFLEVCDGWGWENDRSYIRVVYWIL